MQKIVGSNPISRFASNPLHTATSPFAGGNAYQTEPVRGGCDLDAMGAPAE